MENPEVNMNIRIKKAAGFTLVEVMVVVTLVGMLAGISVPSVMKARDTASLNVIRANLRTIQDVKQQWALDTRAANSAVPTEADLQGYLRTNQMPKPLVGEVYSLNAVGEEATAVIPVPVGGLPAGSIVTY
ncbi:MAG: prepilin-type N-terminal cleavage/methylation domain-containing protein [Verrucomicrobia bacterium]|nr:prepilin-type N-terminal cleavage/methylation domain-containing protein [Verrucomicrobiota bacterium]